MIFPNPQELSLFKATPGAISVHEMVAIINVVAQVPIGGTYAEMGSHRGKSGVATAIGMKTSPFTESLHLVDPLYDMNNLEAWKHACQGHPDNAWQGAKEAGFCGSVVNLISAASDGEVTAVLHGDFSTHAIPEICGVHGNYSYVLLDTDQHTYELTTEELKLLRTRMKVGGLIGFHDFKSQFLGVEQAYREMLTSTDGIAYEEVPIDWEPIKKWVAGNGGEAGNTSWHHCEMDAPCFYGALKRVK